jgi:hypothetical protein
MNKYLWGIVLLFVTAQLHYVIFSIALLFWVILIADFFTQTVIINDMAPEEYKKKKKEYNQGEMGTAGTTVGRVRRAKRRLKRR